MPEEESISPRSDEKWRLRGLLWRMQLGVLPSRFDSVDALRRASADGRRRYADLRRRLLVDPHLMEEGQKPPDVSMDNPLSLDPDSVWGKYFRNAEIERIIDKDLSRLYPEHGNFFQGSGCQAMFRRILLVWSLTHPQLSYRQGMHELLAPLLYVLHIDVLQITQIKKRYEDLFSDRFDDDSGYKPSRARLPFNVTNYVEDERNSQEIFEHDELNVDLNVIVMGSDTYGAEGELGALFSARFMEHDAYCMFDALLSCPGGAVRMIDYFITSGIPDASAALYRTLAAADFSLYAHLVELGVQPQYFALRWLRLLFGREFGLEDLLLVWDAIFSEPNEIVRQDDDGSNISARSCIISAIAVSLLLHSRAALLAAPDATGCLQRLLNSPHIQDVRKFLENAKRLQPLAQEAVATPPPPVAKRRSIKSPQKSSLLRQGSTPCSPDLLKMFLAEGYWEEKWKSSVLQKSHSDEGAGKTTDARRRESLPKPVLNGSTVNTANISKPPAETTTNGSNSASPPRPQAHKPATTDQQRDEPEQVVPQRAEPDKVATEAERQPKRAEPDKSVTEAERQPQRAEPDKGVAEVERPEASVEPTIVEEQVHEAEESNGLRALKSFEARGEDDDVPVPVSYPVNEGKKVENSGKELDSGHTFEEVVTINDPLGVSSSRPTSSESQLKKLSLKKDDTPKKSKGPVALKSLGQSMVEHIQVLEGVLSQKAREGDQFTRAIVGSKGHVSAMVALAELRKISNALLHM